MNDWLRMLTLAPLAGAIVTAPVSAQDDDWSDDEDPLVTLDERLEGLDDMIDFSFGPGLQWFGDDCEEGDDCEVHVFVKDGEQTVIINGDTVKNEFPIPHAGAFAYRFEPRMDSGHRFGLDHDILRGLHSFADPKLRELEGESRSLARKARRAKGAEKVELEQQLDRKLNEIFDYKLERREKALEKSERRLSGMKERLAKRKSARDEIIQNRKDELLGTEQYLEW